jgi:hypothetical protein
VIARAGVTAAPTPQLSTSAAPLDAGKLSQVIEHQAATLLVARSHGAIVGMLTLAR